MWFGQIVMGINQTDAISVVFDTGSDWLIIPDGNCSTCSGPGYWGEYNSIPLTNTSSERHYGDASFYGKEHYDYVCLTQNNTCAAMDYFLVFE